MTTIMDEAPVTIPSRSRWRRWGIVAMITTIGVGTTWLYWDHLDSFRVSQVESAAPVVPVISVARDAPEAVDVDPDLIKRMHIEWTAARPMTSALPLRLSGQLMLDPSRLVHVQSRFTGEVISVGYLSAAGANASARAATHPGPEAGTREIQVGDRVIRGQLLAVIWSREVGEKKSDLVDALCNLWLHESLLKKLKSAGEGTVAQRAIDEMQRLYESDLISVSRWRRTLRSWHIDEHELVEIEEEAMRLHLKAQQSDGASKADEEPANLKRDQRWAEMDIHAPRDGVLLEKNFTVGDIVDPTLDLFKIADLSRLGVLANLYEDDLPKLLGLPPEERRWQIVFPNQPSCPECSGRIETIGHVIDPNQHTTIVTGWVENPGEQLRVGQFARAMVEMPGTPPAVSVPLSALIDQGEDTCVLVVTERDHPRLQRRWVTVLRRTPTEAWLSVAPQESEGSRIAAGDLVVTSGTIELHAKLVELLASDAFAANAAKATSP